MAENSKIEWTDATWNPVLGCDKVSPGCANCYAVKTVWRMAHNPLASIHEANTGLVAKQQNGLLNWTGVVRCLPDRLKIPLGWKKPRLVFVNSQSDLFHQDVSDAFIDQVFAVMALCPQHTFQILTKRPAHMQRYFTGRNSHLAMTRCFRNFADYDRPVGPWPLPNVWLGVSVEDQKTADERIPYLLGTPAAVRFLSMEPLLEEVNIEPYLTRHVVAVHEELTDKMVEKGYSFEGGDGDHQGLDWVITGGESGPHARPSHPDWFRSLRDQCQAADVPFFFKQHGAWAAVAEFQPQLDSDRFRCMWPDGGWNLANPAAYADKYTEMPEMMQRVGKKAAGRLLDGRTWDELPETR